MQNEIVVESPNQFGYTIYSKNNCPYCVKAKALIKDAQIIECDGYLTADKSTFLKYMDAYSRTEYRTFPMIFYDGEFIGGFTSAQKHFDKLQSFNEEF